MSRSLSLSLFAFLSVLLTDTISSPSKSHTKGLGVGRGASTQVLIGDYSSQFGQGATSSRAPLRTPLQENIIMQEAKNHRAFREMTPLAGMCVRTSVSMCACSL